MYLVKLFLKRFRRQSYKRSFGYTAVTYATEPPHTVLEASTKHEEETNKGTKPKKARLPRPGCADKGPTEFDKCIL